MNTELVGSPEVDALASKIEVNDPETIVTFGAEVAEEISKASDVVLNSMNMSQLDASSGMLADLAKIMSQFDINEVKEEEPGFFKKLFANARKELDKILANNAAYIKAAVPAGTYTGVDYDTKTFGVKCCIIVKNDMDEDLVYDLCKAMNEGAADMAAGNALLKDMTNPEFLCTQMPIPLHPGAEKYFKEIGVLK